MREKVDNLVNYMDSFIFKNNNRYKEDGYDIYLNNNYLYINYKNSIIDYKAFVIEENGELYWMLVPYKDSYYTTLIIDPSVAFDRLLFAIRQNEVLKNETF